MSWGNISIAQIVFTVYQIVWRSRITVIFAALRTTSWKLSVARHGGNRAIPFVTSECLFTNEFQGGFAVPPGYHGQDEGYYWST